MASDSVLLIRADLFHTPRDPFSVPGALEAVADGALAIANGRILASGPYAALRRTYPDAAVEDARPAILLPGLVDLHCHFPQAWMIGAMRGALLKWLCERTVPEEAKLADPARATTLARGFLAALARNGTTTALVFGAHFPAAQATFFAEAERSRLRIASGLVLADRGLAPELHLAPEVAHAASLALIRRWHGRGRLRYAVSPRFALACSEGMLEAAGDLLRAAPGVLCQTHLNESRDEVAAARRDFPWARDYLSIYERYGLVTTRSVFAHDVHPMPAELDLLGERGAKVAHCPTSNLFLGSGLFPMGAHRERGVGFGLGSDVAGGTGYSLLKEGLAAYGLQALRGDGPRLSAGHLLYLATLAGAKALGLDDEVGDLSAGKAADFCLIRPLRDGTLASVLAHADSADDALGAVFALATEADVAQTYVAGKPLLPVA